MTEVAIAQTQLTGRAAGEALGRDVREQLSGAPDALIVFSAPSTDHIALLQALAEAAGTRTIVGCSSAGEFTGDASGHGMTNVTAIRSTDIRFAASVGTGISQDHAAAARQLVGAFNQERLQELPFRAALVLVDALAGHTEELVDAMTVATGGTYRFFGGGAGDDARFQTTHVFCGTEAYRDAVVALEIVSRKPIGIGARHGWVPASPPLRVTQSDAAHVVSLNAAPAVEAFEEHAEGGGARPFDRADPLPYFLHNIVGVETPSGYKLRVPLGIDADGGVVCAAEVPTGTTAHIMSTGGGSASAAAAAAARDAVEQVTRDGGTPKAALFFDCVATRLRLGESFDEELDAVAKELGVPFAGFNSYGQIVRAEGQFSGFHNCTAVVCVLPE